MIKKTILIIEDEVHLRETWGELLAYFKYNFILASNGKEGIRQLEKNHVDAVITDLQMPEEDGYSVLDYLKSRNLNVVTIVCSGQIPSLENLAQYKIDKIITKPLDMIAVIKGLEALFSQQN